MEIDEFAEQVKSQITELSRRIADFENVKAENVGLKQKLENQTKKIDDLTKEVLDFKNSQLKIESELKKYNLINDQKIESIFNLIELCKKNNEDHKSSIQILNCELININDSLNKFNTFLFSITELIDSIKSDISNFASFNDSLDTEILKLERTCEDLRIETKVLSHKQDMQKSSLDSDVANSINEISKIKNEVDILKCELKSIIDYNKKLCNLDHCNIKNQIDLIKIPDTSNFINKNELNDLKREFNLCSLDSVNSVSKCNNLESQLTIFCKKIDNIQIYLKSIELKLVDEPSKQLK